MLSRKVPGLSELDIKVLEIIEHGHKIHTHGKFMESLVNAIVYADADSQERFRLGFPEVMASFDKWKRGESGSIYDAYIRKGHREARHLSIVEN